MLIFLIFFFIMYIFSVDCLYEATPQLTYQFEASVVAPGESVDVPFTFCPRRAAKYHEVVTFEVNGLSKQKVEFSGTGSEMKVCDLFVLVGNLENK